MRAVAAVVLAAALLTGCGRSPDLGAAATAAPSVDPTPIPQMVIDHPIVLQTPTAEPVVEPSGASAPPARESSGNLSYETTDGYKYRLTWTAPTVTVTADKANAKPSFVLVDLNVAFAGFLHNETVDHTAPSSGPTLVPFWKASSPVCKLDGSAPIGESKTYCELIRVNIYAPEGETLLAGKMASIVGTSNFTKPIAVGEMIAPEIQQDLKSPYGWLFVLTNPAGGPFCQLGFGSVIWSSPALDAQGTC